MQQRSKVLLALALALILVFALVAMAQADDYSSHWSADFSAKAIERGWIVKDANGNIGPDMLATRAEYVMMLWRALGQPTPQKACIFTDIPEGVAYRNAATALNELGIVNGMTATTFGPNLNLTREMSFTMLARAFNLDPANMLAYQQFSDHAAISDWARNAISALYEKAYITGTSTTPLTCSPKQNLKRGEMIKIVIGVYDGVQAATATANQQAAAFILAQNSSTLSLSLNLEVTASDEATILITAKDSGEGLKYLGWRSCNKDDVFTNNTGFKEVSLSTEEITVSDNGYYAVFVINKKNGYTCKIIQVSNISDGAVPKLEQSDPDDNNEVTITVKVPSGTTADLIAWRTAKANAVYTSKSDFPISGSNSKYDITDDKEFTVSSNGWYAVCMVDKNKDFGYALIEVDSIDKDTYYDLEVFATPTAGGKAIIGTNGTKTEDEYKSGTKVTVTATANSGYTFDGWYDKASGGTKKSGDASYEVTITKDTELYAIFSAATVQPTTYTVTFDSQGGSSVGSKTVTAPATKIDALPSAPTMDGFTFGGWFTQTNGGGTEFTANTTVAANITVYAKWTAVEITPPIYASHNLSGQNITVACGTIKSNAEADLPSEVTFTGTNGEMVNVNLSWNIDGYNASTPGEYQATATYNSPTGWTGSFPTITGTVTVQEP